MYWLISPLEKQDIIPVSSLKPHSSLLEPAYMSFPSSHAILLLPVKHLLNQGPDTVTPPLETVTDTHSSLLLSKAYSSLKPGQAVIPLAM